MADIDSLLTDEELELFRKVENCTTIEELQKLEAETNTINESKIPRLSYQLLYDSRGIY